jgi:hypothetical protein
MKYLIMGVMLLVSCRNVQINDPVKVLQWEISGTWQNMRSNVYDDLDYTFNDVTVELNEIDYRVLKGSIKTGNYGFFTGESTLEFVILNGSLNYNTVTFDARMETANIVLHFTGTIQDKINKLTRETDKVIVGYFRFEYSGGRYSEYYKLYLKQQEIKYLKQTWHDQGSASGGN